MSAVFDKTFQVLEKAADMYMLRHSVISDNMANAETPGYKARRVDFEEDLQREMAVHVGGAQPKFDLEKVKPSIYEDPLAEVGLDRNSVDMEREMAQLSKNQIKYNATTQLISRKFALLKMAVRGGNDR